MAHVNSKHGKNFLKKIEKFKNTKIKIKCVGGGGGESSLFALSDLYHTATVGTIFLASTTVLPYRLLLQTTCYNHLRVLLHLHSSSKEKQKQQQAKNPLNRGG